MQKKGAKRFQKAASWAATQGAQACSMGARAATTTAAAAAAAAAAALLLHLYREGLKNAGS